MSDALMEKMLGLPEFEVTDFKQNDNDMGFYVQTKAKPNTCLACGCYQPALTVAKTRTQKIRDINSQNKRVVLILKRRYYKCAECKQIFSEPLNCVEAKGRMTIRFRDLIAQKASTASFIDIENEFQISDTTVRTIFLDAVAKLPSLREMETPELLGIDEIYLLKDDYKRKRAWGVIGNGDKHTVMELLRNNSNQTIKAALQQLQNLERVKIVTMDMKTGYRTVVREVFPDALIVIDKFHIVKMANEQVDSIRKQCCKVAPQDLKRHRTVFLSRESSLSKKRLAARNKWFKLYPKLEVAYRLKEAFFPMYDCSNRAEAERYYAEWKKQIPPDDAYNGFRMMCRTIGRCHDEVFNYFNCNRPATNAFVEGMNNAIRVISVQGRGYDFDVLRGKVLMTACLKW